MKYALIQNNQIVEYPVFEGDIRSRFPHISFGQEFTPPDSYHLVEDSPFPNIDYTKNVIEGEPTSTSNGFVVNWVVTDASAEEIAERIEGQWQNVRLQRNSKLIKSDWTQLADAPLTTAEKAAWATRRQAWRDITNQADPFNLVWPDE